MTRPTFTWPWLTAYAAIAVATAVALGFVRINTTPSMPPGIYLRLPLGAERPAAGDDVFACMPPGPDARLALERGYIPRGVWPCASGGVPLLKHVLAAEGETVVVGPRGVYVGRRLAGPAPPSSDSLGRPLRPRVGEWRLGPGELWLGSDIVNGYDSRYLGPISSDLVLGRARLLVRI
jgi:conjugative transfer signal peptidase TraF